MTDGQLVAPLPDVEQEHVDQYSGWLTLDTDLERVTGILAEMPGMDTVRAQAVVEEFRLKHSHDRDLILALIDFGMQSMANPNSPHFAFKVRNMFARFGVLAQGVTDRGRLLCMVKDLTEVLSDEIAIGHPAKDAVSELMCSLTNEQVKNLPQIVKNIQKTLLSTDARVIRLMQLRHKHFIPSRLVVQS